MSLNARCLSVSQLSYRGYRFYNVRTAYHEADDDEIEAGIENEDSVILQDKGVFTCLACKARPVSCDAPVDQPPNSPVRRNTRRVCRNKRTSTVDGDVADKKTLCGCWVCDPSRPRPRVARFLGGAPCSMVYTRHRVVMQALYPDDTTNEHFEDEVMLPE